MDITDGGSSAIVPGFLTLVQPTLLLDPDDTRLVKDATYGYLQVQTSDH